MGIPSNADFKNVSPHCLLKSIQLVQKNIPVSYDTILLEKIEAYIFYKN